MIPSPTSPDWMLTFTVKSDCIQDGRGNVYITINIKNIDSCGILRKLLFTEQRQCKSNNSLGSCSVLNPADSGPWCRAKCMCEEQNCEISVVVMEGMPIHAGMKLCEAGVTKS